ncbi:MAG: amino acid-binding protein [Bacteroidales bacterium]|nr:amino acid-binding protein [Bacteroidales bacterium]
MAFEVSVFLENKIAHLEGITNVLKSENINIRSLTLSNIMHGWGVLNLLVDQPEKAYKVLTEKGNSVFLREVIVLGMKDEAGSLDELLIKLSRTGIHIENAYTRLVSETNTALMVLDVPDVIEAGNRLLKNGIHILDDDSVYRK